MLIRYFFEDHYDWLYTLIIYQKLDGLFNT